jgi:hypothetical protein
MKRLIAWGVWLYPPQWRARYGEEFRTLVEDSRPSPGDLLDVIRGAILMQMTSVTVPKIVVGFALAGLLGAGVWAWMSPNVYESKTTLRLHTDEPRPAVLHRLETAQQAALSRNSLSGIIQRENLYPDERKQLPLEDVITEMQRKSIRIAARGSDVELSFVYPDPAAAQRTARDLVAALNSAEPVLEVLDPATAPSTPTGPNRTQILGGGLLAGLVFGLLAGGIWTILRGPRRNLKQIGAFAAAGMALGGAVAFLIPDQFISTAILWVGDEARLQPAMQTATGTEALNQIAHKYGLYGREQDAAARMRNDIRVQKLPPRTGVASATAFAISFRSSDRIQARAVTSDLMAAVMQEYGSGVEVLDPPSDPHRPSSPNRFQIIVLGIAAGALLGLVSTRFRRPAAAAA